ncbi:MAG: glycosyltransferase [Eubacterium sp.]|nr:glycosyltransferase [Eubacterium sp.]
MKVLLYSENMRFIKVSGLGRAIMHQKQALSECGIEHTDKPSDDGWDVVHINTYGLNSRRIAKKARKKGKAVVYHAHSTKEDFMDSFIGSNMFAGVFKKWIVSCYNLGDVIITPTEYSKSLLEGYGITKPIFAVSNGVRLDFFKKRAADREEFRKKFGYSDSDKVVIAVGLYLRRKGVLDFVELAKAMPDYKFIWFGKTPLFTVPHEIRKAVKTKLDNLCFAGYVQPDELKKAYAGCDAYIFPTHEETEGIVLLEALASKAPAIIRDIPAFSWLKDNEVYKAKDNEDFKHKIRALVEGELPSLADNGYNAVSDKDISLIGSQLINVYQTAQKEAEKNKKSAK